MRSKNAFRNLVISLIYEAFILALGLIIPRFIILSFGDSVNGLTQTINRLLSLVNLLQAGAVGASIFQMFKPVVENDYNRQSAIMYSSKKFFNKMGVIYLAIMVAFSLFFGFYLKDENLTMIEIILSFGVLSINGSLYFFFNSRYDIVFSSYQKKYLLTISSFFEKIVYYAMLLLVIKGNLYFMFMYVALLCGGVIRVLINTHFYNKFVGKKITNNPEDKKYVIKDRKFLMLASIGDQTIAAAPTVIVTTLINLAASSVFSVYSMIYISMKTLIDSLHHAVSAIFGNLVTTSDNKKIASVFNILVYMFVMLGTFLSSCVAFLFMDFIGLYSYEFSGTNYYHPVLACFIVAYIAIFAVKTVYYIVSNVYGLFKFTCKTTLICGAISLVVSIITTLLFGMPYVMVGVLVYHFSTMCVLLIEFKKQISWFKMTKSVPRAIIIIILPTLSWCLYKSGIFHMNGWIGWFVAATSYALVVGIILFIYTLVFERRDFFLLIDYVKAILKYKKTKKKV